MSQPNHIPAAAPEPTGYFPAFESPFLHAPEGARTVFLVTAAAACGPLAAGLVLFGWRAGVVTALCVAACVLTERLYFFVTRTPALLGRSHGYLTALLLALTLPAYVPWYVPVVAGVFAIIVGKGIFGGVGHFLWQPALVGRLAVAVMFPVVLAGPDARLSGTGAILAQENLVVGDIRDARYVSDFRQWRNHPAPEGADALLVDQPVSLLRGLTQAPQPPYSALAEVPTDLPRAKPAALRSLPRINALLLGARPGGIGETCALIIVVAGLYLVYRNYVKIELPLAFLLAAAAVAAVAPVRLAGPQDTVVTMWFPILGDRFSEGQTQLDVGFVYVWYQLLSGAMFLAAFFLATEMTSRPVTSGGQVIFGVGAGALAMLLKLYFDTPIPSYMAVLAMNTLTPTIDAIWRPRVLGQRHFSMFRPRGRRVRKPSPPAGA